MRTYCRKTTGRLRHLSLTLTLLPVLGMTVCQRNSSTPTDRNSSTPPKVNGPAAAVATSTYEGEGRVVALDPKRPSIEIDHQEIKGLMPAMTMQFYVKDKSLLEGLKPGDNIEFTIDYGVGGLVISRIKKK